MLPGMPTKRKATKRRERRPHAANVVALPFDVLGHAERGADLYEQWLDARAQFTTAVVKLAKQYLQMTLRRYLQPHPNDPLQALEHALWVTINELELRRATKDWGKDRDRYRQRLFDSMLVDLATESPKEWRATAQKLKRRREALAVTSKSAR